MHCQSYFDLNEGKKYQKLDIFFIFILLITIPQI